MATELLFSNNCDLIRQLSFWVASMLLASFGLLAVHEVGHLLAARWSGIPVKRVRIGLGPTLCALSDRSGTNWSVGMMPIAGHLELRNGDGALTSVDPRALAVMHAAGPGANLLLSLAIYGLSLALFGEGGLVPSQDLHLPALAASMLSGLSIAIGLYNLVPIPPLDGGLLLVAALRALRGKRGPANSGSWVLRVGLTMNVVASVLLLSFLVVGLLWER